MKKSIISLLFASACLSHGQDANYQNFIRQVQLPHNGSKGLVWNVPVGAKGSGESALPIDGGGARFELHTVRTEPFTGYLLDTKYVGSYIPVAVVKISTEDPYKTVPRTRADRPFNVEISISGLLSGVNDPGPSKKVKLLHHVQSYGANGNGIGIDKGQATLYGQSFITTNGSYPLSYLVSSVPGANRAKVRGEERFSIYSLADSQAPESHLDSATVQIWPVADGTISGITAGQLITHHVPDVTFAVNDIYPDAQIYAHVYQGPQILKTQGTVITGSGDIITEAGPQKRVLVTKDWDHVITTDGVWTIELMTATPFGHDRLDYVTFNVDRTISVNSSVTTSE